MSDVLRIQRPRLIHIIRSFDNRAAVGEDGELVAIGDEFEKETVVADLAVGFEMPGHLLEMEARRATVGHLDSIAAAEAGRVRAVFAVEPPEAAMLAARAIGRLAQLGNLEALVVVFPNVDVDQIAADLLGMAGQDLERLG